MREARQAHQAFAAFSLDAPLSGSGDPGLLGDVLGEDDPDLAHATDIEAVRAHLDELPEREQRILMLRFYGNLTQEQIGDRLGISQMHVSRLGGRLGTWWQAIGRRLRPVTGTHPDRIAAELIDHVDRLEITLLTRRENLDSCRFRQWTEEKGHRPDPGEHEMRASELTGCQVYDADGRAVGTVRDLQFRLRARPDGSQVCQPGALERGGTGLGRRLGYGEHAMRGPWPFPPLFRYLARRSPAVPWPEVTAVNRPRIDTSARRAQLQPARRPPGNDPDRRPGPDETFTGADRELLAGG